MLGLVGLAAVAAAQVPGAGREAKAPADDPSEILITGERVPRRLRETPSSVLVFGRRDLDSMATPDRVQQLLELVPNVLIASSRDTPTIRGQASAGVLGGLPAFLGGARPRTVLQVDGRTVTFNEFVNSTSGLWDVDRVEVFRSPQTTTQGVNSIAGAIFIHTADPAYRFESRVRAIGGEVGRAQLSAVVSGPLVGDQLAFRVAGDLYRSHAANRMSGPIVGANLNHDRYSVARAKLLAEPRSLPGLRVLVTYAHTQTGAPQGEGARRPFRKRRDDNCVCGYIKANTDSVTSETSYAVSPALESRTTVSWGDILFRRFSLPGFGVTRVQGRDRALESVLDWKPGGSLSAVGGLAIQAAKLSQFIDLSVTPLGTGSFVDRQTSRGLFGEVTWRPSAVLSVTGGARYQSDTKRRVGVLRTSPPLPLDYDKAVHALLPKISAAYDLSPEVRIGFLIERAYNPGGVTLDPTQNAQIEFRPEYLWDYEAYSRASFLGGALNVAANLFYNDSRNAQRTLDICLRAAPGCVGLSEVSNAPRARAYGAEMEASFKASDRLSLRAAIGFLRTRVTRTLTPTDPILGKPFGSSPKFTGMAAIEWRPVGKLTLSSQVRHNSSYFGDDSSNPALRVSASTTVDARASWAVGRFVLFAYAQNLFDELHVTTWDTPRDDPNIEVTLNDPREVGFGLEARF